MWRKALIYFGLVEDPNDPRSEQQRAESEARSSVFFITWIVVGLIVGLGFGVEFWSASGTGALSGVLLSYAYRRKQVRSKE